MFDVHIDYLFYKKFVGQPEFILNLYAWIYLYIFENYELIIFVSILNVFWKPMASRY